jgi:hypothetical protein
LQGPQSGDLSEQKQGATRGINIIERALSTHQANISLRIEDFEVTHIKFLAHHIANILISCYPFFILKKYVPLSYLKRRSEIGKKGEQNEK